MRLTFTILITLLLLADPLSASARPRHHDLYYQGRLSDASGKPVDGSIQMTFRLYPDPDSSDSLWEETQVVSVKGGRYAVQLGNTQPIAADIFEQDNLQLGIQIESDSEMTPRLSFHAVPWAHQAYVAMKALSLADRAVTSEKIAPGSVGERQIAGNAVGSRELKNTGVVPGTYSWPTLKVDEDGRIVTIVGGSLPSTPSASVAPLAWNQINWTGVVPAQLGAAPLIHGHRASDITEGELKDTQVSNQLTIYGGVIDRTTIGGTEPSVGTFSHLRANHGLTLQDTVAGPESVDLMVPDLASSYTLTLPPNTGLPGQTLVTDGHGVLSWATFPDTRLPSDVSRLGPSIESSEITDGAIVNADINTGAAIDGSKVHPDFGSQNVTTSGNITATGSGGITAGGDIAAAGGFRMMLGPFEKKTVPKTATASWELGSDGNKVTHVPAPWSGSVMGVSIRCDQALTAGTLTAEASINTTGTGLSASLASSQQKATLAQAKDLDTFAVGDDIGCSVTASGDFAPNNKINCACMVFVEM